VSVLDVVVWPAKVLETRANEVTKFDDDLRKFVGDLHDTMHAAAGIGLAANQVGDLRRVVAIEIPFGGERYGDQEETREWWHDKRFTFINPKITKKAGKFKFQEGCLSFPDIFEFVERAAEVWVTAQDEHGKEFEVHATGLFAVCLQHEIDHIDGHVFIERMSRLKANMVRKKIARRGVIDVKEEEAVPLKTTRTLATEEP
jgi:peptide deformylase